MDNKVFQLAQKIKEDNLQLYEDYKNGHHTKEYFQSSIITSENTGKVNRHMRYIKQQSIENLEEDRVGFLKSRKPALNREEQHLVNEVFAFLKQKA